MNAITVRDLRKSYTDKGTRVSVLEDLSLTVADREILCLFGPNGCGKTTLINVCARLIQAESGSVQIFDSNPEDVKIGYIPQAFSESLFPWLNSLDNISFPLCLEGLTQKDAREKASALLERFDIGMPLSNYPYECSGGQKQLTALARALVSSPAVLLADEPFSALDYKTRLEIQDKFLEIVSDHLHLATVFISHQIEDAIYLGDRLIVFSTRPARIVETFDIDLPRPRKQEMKHSKEFLELSARAIDAFLRGVDYES
jgi:NitT/TauT family transport system ATP-binding protein